MSASPREQYYRKRFARNRSLFARIVDRTAFLLIVFMTALLFFRGRIADLTARLILALIVSAAVGVAARIVNGLRYEAFCKKETERLREALFFQNLKNMPETDLHALLRPLRGKRRLLLLRRVERADADAAFAALREADPIALFSTGGFTDSARAFAADADGKLLLIEPAALLPEARSLNLLPGNDAVDQEAERLALSARSKRKRAVQTAFSGSFPGKYYLCAAGLIALSFFTRYALYYRILALFPMLVAVTGSFLSRAGERNAGA